MGSLREARYREIHASSSGLSTWNSEDVENEYSRGTALGSDGTLYFTSERYRAPLIGLYGAFDGEGAYQ